MVETFFEVSTLLLGRSVLIKLDMDVNFGVGENYESQRVSFKPKVRVPNPATSLETPLPPTPVEDGPSVFHVVLQGCLGRES